MFISIIAGTLLTQLPLHSKFVALKICRQFSKYWTEAPAVYQGSRETKDLIDVCNAPFPLSV